MPWNGGYFNLKTALESLARRLAVPRLKGRGEELRRTASAIVKSAESARGVIGWFIQGPLFLMPVRISFVFLGRSPRQCPTPAATMPDYE